MNRCAALCIHGCAGAIRTVRVNGFGLNETYAYCDRAVDLERARGFEVTEVRG